MTYTINQLSKLAGVSVRTLHYYDQIDLLKPSYTKENRYRYYEDKQLDLLQQILFFRELDFPLEKIRQIIKSPGYDSVSALTDQQKLLEAKKLKLDRLLHTIILTIKSLKDNQTMSNDDKFSPFNDPTYQQYKDEVTQKWGNTDAYKQSMQRVAKMTKADWAKVKSEGDDITRQLADLYINGKQPQNQEAQIQIDRFYNHLRYFYDPDYQMFKNLGQMYVDDHRFTAYYDNYAPGMAVFMRDAMAFYAEKHL